MEYKMSVIIPVYNVQDYLDKCLKSVIDQTLDEIQIIVVNDGSTDNSQSIVDRYAIEYPDKILSLIKKNGGLSDARNYGLKFAKGEYITFLDSDDYVDTNLYEKMYNATNSQKKIIECDFIYEYPDKSIIDKRVDFTSKKEYMLNGRVIACNKIYRRDWLFEIGAIFPLGLLFEDVEFFFKIVSTLNNIDEIGYVESSFYHYLQRNSSISKSCTNRITDIITIYNDIINYYKAKDIFDEYYSEIEYKYVRNSLCAFMRLTMHIQNKAIKKRVIYDLWNHVNETFPEWRRNKYINERVTKNHLVMKLYNNVTIKLLTLI